jgi:glycerol uptake facilitator-like aquaporin
LLATIAGGIRFAPPATPMLVGLYISGAYWFTASTSFANPAVTIARTLTNSFSGIAPTSAPQFIAAQILAALVSVPLLGWLFGRTAEAV